MAAVRGVIEAYPEAKLNAIEDILSCLDDGTSAQPTPELEAETLSDRRWWEAVRDEKDELHPRLGGRECICSCPDG